jgi:two-component system nitrogen regulation response regulator NtrX
MGKTQRKVDEKLNKKKKIMTIIREILVVEDNYEICEMMRDILGEQGYNVTVAKNTKTAMEAVEKIRPHLIILDIWLEGNHLDGIGLLKKMKQMFNDVPIVMISGHANVELAASTIRFGAYDFIEKPFKTEKLLLVVKRALERRDLLEINAYLQHNSYNNSIFKVSSGNSKAAQKLRNEIKAIAASNCRMVISGEIGSQTAYVAREIHDQSPRSHQPIISLNSILHGDTEDMSMIIFGNDKEPSLFERANGGTLVLENIQTLSHIIQAKLLDALQKECITRNNKVIKFDVRVIGTFEANCEVTDFIKRKVVNEMLYHRLNVKNLIIPPLNSRIDDIIELFTLAAAHYMDRNASIDLGTLRHALISYNWPCNTQELCNSAEYFAMNVMIQNADVASVEMLNGNIVNALKTDFASFANIAGYLDMDYKSAKRHFDIEYIKAQLRRFSNNVAKTARFMGVDRAALYRKIRSLIGIHKIGEKKIVELINNNNLIHKEDKAVM